jgi:hypothetical protein
MTTFANIAPTTAKLLRLLGSDKPGEIIASVHALRRVLGSVNLDLHDLATMVEGAARREIPRVEMTADNPFSRMHKASTRRDVARAMLRRCGECSDLLSAKEIAFIRTLTTWRGEPSARQLAWLSSLYERCMKGEHA